MNNTNKVAIISGGAMGYKNGGSSIGGAAGIQLAKDGYKVVIVDEGEMGKRTEEIIQKNGGKALFIQADVTDTAQVKSLVEKTVSTFGGVHCLVNCVAKYSAGMNKSVVEIEEKDWQDILNVNLNGYFKMIKYTAPEILKSGGGTIINISSIESFAVLPNFAVYSVSKAAVDAMTRTLAIDLSPQIRTNSVVPGFVKIANSERDRSPEELEKWYESIAQSYPMKRVCEVEEIANVISFLASEKSSYINGQSLIVDGGRMVADSHAF
jgi:NAD(P)-dependent dehydrogenase (short-subunit alcohol dehydrogenase family)